MVEWKYINEIIVSLKTGLNPRQNFRLNTPESIFPYITGKDIFNNKINVTSVTDRVDSKAVDLINKRAYLEDNLLLFASTGTGTVGRMAIIEKYESDWAISETLYAIKTTDAISPQFLMYSLYSDIAKKQYEPKISKGSVPHLKIVDLLKVKIPIPSLEEQTRIVGILDTFTSAIDNLKEQIAQRKKQYEYYRDQLLDLEGKPGVEMKSLSNCCSLITKQTGFDYSKTIKPSLTTAKLDDSIPFIQNKDFEGTRINLNTDFYIPFSIAQQFPKIMLNEKILLVSISGKIGNVGLYELNNVSFVGGAICVCRLRKENNGRYILYYLLSHKGQSTLFRSVKAASHSNITVESIRETLIPLPSLQEQQRIVSILDTFETSIQNLEAQLALREKQYEYYRNKLLTFD